MTTTVWITISRAISSPVGAAEPATRAAMTNVAVYPTTTTEASRSLAPTVVTLTSLPDDAAGVRPDLRGCPEGTAVTVRRQSERPGRFAGSERHP
jgi:hypothetical protein